MRAKSVETPCRRFAGVVEAPSDGAYLGRPRQGGAALYPLPPSDGGGGDVSYVDAFRPSRQSRDLHLTLAVD